jgi:hypothetical protein
VKNITISLPDEVALRARIWAAEADASLSSFLCRLLTERIESEAGYQRAAGDFFSRQPVTLQETPAAYPTRDELHDRASLG